MEHRKQRAHSEWLRPELEHSWLEFTVILILTLGPFMFSEFFGGYITLFTIDSYSGGILSTCTTEVLILSPFLFYLFLRGWRLNDFRLTANLKTLFIGILLFFIIYLANYTYYYAHLVAQHPDIPIHFIPSRQPTLAFTGHINWLVLVTVGIIDPIYEELILMGYIFNQLEKKISTELAVCSVAALRVLMHLYLGSTSVLPFFVLGFGFSVAYAIERRLTSLIIAHVLYDIAALSMTKLLLDPNIVD